MKNTGKPTEARFEASINALGKRGYFYRIKDAAAIKGLTGSVGQGVDATPSDYICAVNDKTFFCEVKSTQHETLFEFKLFRKGQNAHATRIIAAGGNYLVVIHQIKADAWYVAPKSFFVAHENRTGRKSITWPELEPFQMYDGRDPRGETPKVVKEEIVQIGPHEVPIEKEHRVAFPPQPGGPCFDYMIDIETTGTNPEENAIIQIAAVRFNRLTKEIDHKMFDRCLTVPDGRYWSESTRDWWMGQPEVLRGIMGRMEDPAIVIKAFWDWIAEGSAICPRAFWSKPTTFDFNFIGSYFRQYGLMQPFHYREAVDLNSYLLGKGHEDRREFWKIIEPVGDAHNALHDCLYQIRAVFNA